MNLLHPSEKVRNLGVLCDMNCSFAGYVSNNYLRSILVIVLLLMFQQSCMNYLMMLVLHPLHQSTSIWQDLSTIVFDLPGISVEVTIDMPLD